MTVKPEYIYPEKIIIGTRGSPLALVQANMVKYQIDKIGQNISVELRVIRTSGDWSASDGEVALQACAGGKAQFAKEIEEALLREEIDIAVHSMKDMETELPDGLIIPYMLPREDNRDALLSINSQNIRDLPDGCTVGTVSVRRKSFLLNARPDLNIVPLRGNVQTRIDKLKSGQVDATLLACAGLNRLGLSDEITSVIDRDVMLPSVGQGAVGIEKRRADVDKISFIGQFSCCNTYICVEAERAVLRSLGGSCHTPVGVHATYEGGVINLVVKVVSLDGKDVWSKDISDSVGSVEEAVAIGSKIGKQLRSLVPEGVLG